MQKNSERIILGIDPGTNLMGYGMIKGLGNTPVIPRYGGSGPEKNHQPLHETAQDLENTLDLIDQYLPDEVAIEAPFFGKNVQSMLKLGRAQGVAMAAVLSRDIPVVEYAPRKIKLSITSARGCIQRAGCSNACQDVST